MLLDKRELVERARRFHFIFSIEIDSLRPSSAMQTDFSEIVKLGLDALPQCENEVQHYCFVAVAVGVVAFLGSPNPQNSGVMFFVFSLVH